MKRPDLAVFADSTDLSMPIVELARCVSERGFRGLFLNEHTHQPIDHPRSPWSWGGEIPERYARFWDPYVALSFVAATTDLEIGPCVSLIGQHDPIVLAKEVATLDHLSGGRLTLGVGYGWHREEFAAHGFPSTERAAVVGEKLALMKALWADDVASYTGKYVHLAPSRSWPKPHQRPHPPILLGVPGTERNFARITAWADGWITMATASVLDRDFADQLQRLREAWIGAGRTGRPTVWLNLYRAELDDLPVIHERASELSVDRLLLAVPDGGSDSCRRHLDATASVLGAM